MTIGGSILSLLPILHGRWIFDLQQKSGRCPCRKVCSTNTCQFARPVGHADRGKNTILHDAIKSRRICSLHLAESFSFSYTFLHSMRNVNQLFIFGYNVLEPCGCLRANNDISTLPQLHGTIPMPRKTSLSSPPPSSATREACPKPVSIYTNPQPPRFSASKDNLLSATHAKPPHKTTHNGSRHPTPRMARTRVRVPRAQYALVSFTPSPQLPNCAFIWRSA